MIFGAGFRRRNPQFGADSAQIRRKKLRSFSNFRPCRAKSQKIFGPAGQKVKISRIRRKNIQNFADSAQNPRFRRKIGAKKSAQKPRFRRAPIGPRPIHEYVEMLFETELSSILKERRKLLTLASDWHLWLHCDVSLEQLLHLYAEEKLVDTELGDLYHGEEAARQRIASM